MFSEILLFLFVVISGVILTVHIILSVGVLINRIRDALNRNANLRLPKVSVIAIARDEEETLPRLLESLEAQSYTGFEIVLVNDRSQDGTAKIMDAFAAKYEARVKVIHNQDEPDHINPKQFALDIAIAEAEGEIFIFTDSDCVVPPGWVENMLPYFKNPRVGVVFGQISLIDSGTFLEKYQAFDQPLIHQYNSGSAGIGIPTGCFGNNLSARRTVIEDIGGFRALGYSLTEDAALIEAAGKRKWKIRVSTLKKTMIKTVPKLSWKGFINQHVRWNSGAYYAQDLPTRLSYRFILLYLIASVAAIPFSFLMPLLLILPVNSFISIGLLSLLSGLLYREDKTAFLLRVVPYTVFFMFFYAFVTLLSILKISPEWKGKKLKSTHLYS